jgi:two-component sensor histidine kinase
MDKDQFDIQAFEAWLAVDPAFLEAIPAAIYLCSADGSIARYNSRAAALWGRTPEIGRRDLRYCGAFRRYNLAGAPLPPECTPVAIGLRDGRSSSHDECVIERPDGSRVAVSVEVEILRGQRGRIEGALSCLHESIPPERLAASTALREGEATRDVQPNHKATEQNRDLLIAELSHRAKNTLAIVIAIAQQTFARNPHVEAELRTFMSRLRALAQTYDHLAEASWVGASLEQALRDELAPYANQEDTNIRLTGPAVMLTPKAALTLGMACHELATNAAKYGALSAEAGAVNVAWRIDVAHNQLRIDWREADGPRVAAPPEKRGFGRFLLERALPFDLGGEVCLDFKVDGLRCDIAVPLDRNIVSAT